MYGGFEIITLKSEARVNLSHADLGCHLLFSSSCLATWLLETPKQSKKRTTLNWQNFFSLPFRWVICTTRLEALAVASTFKARHFESPKTYYIIMVVQLSLCWWIKPSFLQQFGRKDWIFQYLFPHFSPLKPAEHLHLKLSSLYRGTQVPPFSQGFSEQGVCRKKQVRPGSDVVLQTRRTNWASDCIGSTKTIFPNVANGKSSTWGSSRGKRRYFHESN